MKENELLQENEQLKNKLQKVGTMLLVDGYDNDDDTYRQQAVDILGVKAYLRELVDRDYEFSKFDRQLIYQIL